MTEENSSGGLDRRSFLVLGAAATGAAVIPAGIAAADDARKKKPAKPADPFGMGVASGDPTSTSVILWTRLAPKPLELDGGMGKKGTQQVAYEIATDAKFTKNVQKGTVEAPAEYGHSVHLDVQGLTPDTEYYYRFKSGKFITETARTRTAPDPSQPVDTFIFGQTSCANWQSGFYQLYRDLADQGVDYWVVLGDYIYEYGNDGYLRDGKAARTIPWKTETFTIGEYRRQYGLYRSDPDLQALHAFAPYSAIWDDHEVDNNFTGGKDGGDGEAARIAFEQRRAAGFQAFYENHAIRLPGLPDGPGVMPKSMRIYRTVQWGSLASFYLLDTRQYRSDQPGDDTPQDFGDWVEGMFTESATMLGAEQESWLAAELTASTARWNFIAQQVMVTDVNAGAGLPKMLPKGLYNYDAWDGYWAPRDRLVKAITDSKVPNPIILTGDFHCNLGLDVLAEWPDPRDFATMDAQAEATKAWPVNPVAAEIVAGAISSPTFFGGAGLVSMAGPPTVAATPWAKYSELLQNGAVLQTVTSSSVEAQFRVANTFYPSKDKRGKVRADKTVVINDGVPGISSVK